MQFRHVLDHVHCLFFIHVLDSSAVLFTTMTNRSTQDNLSIPFRPTSFELLGRIHRFMDWMISIFTDWMDSRIRTNCRNCSWMLQQSTWVFRIQKIHWHQRNWYEFRWKNCSDINFLLGYAWTLAKFRWKSLLKNLFLKKGANEYLWSWYLSIQYFFWFVD